jgi:hypothetical protein
VSPRIIAGAYQLSERALGQSMINSQQGWSGGYGAGTRVSIGQHSLTVVNPAGATVQGAVDMTCWSGTVGSVIQGSLSVDGAAQAVYSELYFNLAGTHMHYWWNWSAAVGPGAHTFNIGLWVAAGNVQFDGNDGGTLFCWERI